MAPKKKKKEVEEVAEQETLVATTDLEPEPEEVQFTETSYTSASFESLPPLPPEEPKKAKKKKKKLDEDVELKEVKSGEDFLWSEESLPVEEEKPVLVEEAAPKKKGKKKGKKDKDKEEIPDFEKPKNWKKMNKKERDAWLATRIEEWRVEQEAEKLARIAGAKEKKVRLAKERAELLIKDNAEMDIRRDLLDKTCTLFQRYERQKMNYDNRKQVKAEWQQYLRCDGLPDPRVVTQMSTFLHVWKERAIYDDNELDKKCIETLPMLEMLEEFVANSRQYTALQAQSYNEIRLQLRAQLAVAIEFASYHALRDLEKRLKWESIKLCTYQREFRGLKLTLWVAVKMPTRLPKPVEPEREPVDLSFPAISVSVKLPKIIDSSCACVRASRSMIDLLSESSKSFALAADMPNRYEDLFIFNVKEHVEVCRLKKEQDQTRNAFYKALRERTQELEKLLKANVYAKLDKEQEELNNLYLMEPPFLPDPRTFVGMENAKAFKKYLKTCNIRTRTGEINLRKYRICGGILNMDLLVAPPQPKHMKYEVTITTLELPKALKPMNYKVQYRAPGPPRAGVTRTPEEIEAEMKKTEAEYEKLALVQIDLPVDVMWFDHPEICQWQHARKLWTTNYVNDYQYNEITNLNERLNITFRTGVLWPIGIAPLRYAQLPYQNWDVRPEPTGKGVLISVTGVRVACMWLCNGTKVKIKWIKFANPREASGALRTYYNKRFTVKRMAQIMRDASCDFFPDFDAHNHVEGSCPKEWVMERHNYHAMAFMSQSHNFAWSKWNAEAGERNLVMQIREAVDKKRVAKFQLLHVTPQRTTILKCNETVDPEEFTFDPMMGMQFYPDLFTLNLSYGSVDARRSTFGMKYKLVETVFNLLQELKLSSYS